MNIDLLPTSLPKIIRGGKPGPMGCFWVPIFCANCGADGGFVPDVPEAKRAFYLCDNGCVEKFGTIAGKMAVSNEIFWEKLKAEQMELYGRQLTNQELDEALKDEHNILTKLSKDF